MLKKKKTPLEKSLFFLTFVGEYVQIRTGLTQKVHAESNEGMITEEGPITLQGFLLDADDEHYYLGGGPGEISDAIKKSDARHIRIIAPEKARTALDDIMDAASPTGDFN